MIFLVLVSSALLVSSAAFSTPSNSHNSKPELGSSESRGYSSHSSAQPAATYEPREPDAAYSKNSRGYESGEDVSAPHEDYAPKSQTKKTVILAIPVKLALQQASLAEREKAPSSYETSGESYGHNSGSGLRPAYPTSYASYADQGVRIEAGNGNNNAYSSNNNNNNNQYEYAAVAPHSQNSQLNHNQQQPPAYATSASQGYAQSSPVSYHPPREQQHVERPLRTYSDKSPPPKPYQPDNDVDNSPPASYSGASSYEYTPKLSRPSSYAAADDSSYEAEEPAFQPRPRKTYKRPAAYVEESVEEESYSRPSSSSGRLPSKYLSADTDSDAFPGLDGATGYQQELSDIGKGSGASLPSYGSEGLDETDYSSSLSSLGLQSYSSPSLPKSELSYLLNKMPRGFSPVPAASSYGMDLGGGSRLGYPYGFPSRPARRPYAPAPYAPSPYLKSPFHGSPYPVSPASKMYLPAASLRSYSATPYYGAASSPIPASSPFRLSSAVSSGLNLGKTFGSGKGLRIGPLEFGSSGSLFPSIKIKSPVRV